MASSKRVQRHISIEFRDFYMATKLYFMKMGYTELMSAIYATVQLEEAVRALKGEEQLKALSTLGMKALPDVERLEPCNQQEAEDREAILDAYKSNRKDEDEIRIKINRIISSIPKEQGKP